MEPQYNYFMNYERDAQINDGIYQRNMPSHSLEQVYDPRPAQTRQRYFPAMDCRVQVQKPPQNQYNQYTQFNPASKAPFHYYATNIDQESRMRNIFFPLQKGCIQSSYIPSSQGDLYTAPKMRETTDPNTMPHGLLFDVPTFSPNNPNVLSLGYEMFNNHTRNQRANVGLMRQNANKA